MIEVYSIYSEGFSGKKTLEPSFEGLIRAGQVARRDTPSRGDSMSKVMGMRNSIPFLRKVQKRAVSDVGRL